MTIDSVSWALFPGAKQMTRPARLVRELQALGAVSSTLRAFRHGRGASTSQHDISRGVLYPRLPRGDRQIVLSPVFQWGSETDIAWFDAYDDWSLAPDINPIHRLLAARTYERIASGLDAVPVTANSPYMAARLGVSPAMVLPNGVDAELSGLTISGDERVRLIALGHFFKGRTDLDLLTSVVRAGRFDEVILAGGIHSPAIARGVQALRHEIGDRLILLDWITPADIAQLVGKRTVAILPHIVNDYTLSQDPMKLYQFLALGMRVICPRLLWPSWLPERFAFLTGFGDNREITLREWIDFVRPPSAEDRREITEEHSWRRRAETLLEMVGEL